MSTNNFYKAECNGNDFIIALKNNSSISLSTENIQNICSQESTDGLLLVNQSFDGYDFKMDYYNNDGSWETMCANGALCIIKLLQSKDVSFKNNLFLAGDGKHQIQFNHHSFSIMMKPPSFKTDNIDIQGITGAHVDSGAKHFVLISDIENSDYIYNLARKIRYDDLFAPHGVNVNFLNIKDKNTIHVITYEKGVEKTMESCGSGSVAAAYYAFHYSTIASPITIINKGGSMMLSFDKDWNEVWLTSHPEIVLETKYNI